MISITAISFIFLLSVIIGIEIVVPFTKVEESFNTQAAHDLLAWKASLHRYDHNEFPGVVPRSFIGSIVLASLAAPLGVIYEQVLGPSGRDKLLEQHTIRCLLGLLTCVSVWILAKSLPVKDPKAHRVAASILMATTAVTYHIAFYASRTLPNTFALILVNISVALLLTNRVRCGFALLAAGAATIRSDMLVFIAPLAIIYVFVNRSVGMVTGAMVGLAGALAALALTVPIDSLLWGWMLWPEAVVLRFNTIENRSSEWGVSPMHWYFTSATPKAFLLLSPLVFLAPLLTKLCRKEFIASLVFVCLYSLLAHKEVRFIMIVFPVLLCPLACCLGNMLVALSNRKLIRGMVSVGIVGAIIAQLGIVAFQAYASSLNYPGAIAIQRVHSLAELQTRGSGQCNRSVYIDAYAGMTGVTRFIKRVSEPHCRWTYNKDPSLFNKSAGVYEVGTVFDYVIVRHEDKEWHLAKRLYRWVEDVGTVGGVRFAKLAVDMKPFLTILQRIPKFAAERVDG